MRLLLLNPNTTTALTDRMLGVARPMLSGDVTVDGMTARSGVPYISSRADAAIGSVALLEMLAEAGDEYDAALVAAFGDPGLVAAREMAPFPLVGMAEAAMKMATLLGQRFSIITFSPALAHWYRDCVAANGHANRLASLRFCEEAFADIADVAKEKAEALLAIANGTIDEDGADVVIFAGAPLTGLADMLAPRLPVPAVDGLKAGIALAQALAMLGVSKARTGSFARPSAKTSTGLSPALTRLIARE